MNVKKFLIALVLITLGIILLTISLGTAFAGGPSPIADQCLFGEVGTGCKYLVFLPQVGNMFELGWTFGFPCVADCPPVITP